MPVHGAHTSISQAVGAWADVEMGPHRFGGTEFKLGKRELGHIHGDALVDIPFPLHVRDEVVASGLARLHHHVPQSGWVSVYLRAPQDVANALALLRRSYELAIEARERRQSLG